MESQSQQSTAPGSLSWRLSSHPITLLTFLAFRSSSLLVYLFGLLFTQNLYVVGSVSGSGSGLPLRKAFPLPGGAHPADEHEFLLSSVLIFIITILLLAADFYYLKNIAGRRLVGLRWWNEVDPQTGDSKWVFESSEPGTKTINPTDSRFFWLANWVQPLLWVALAVLALVRFMFIWLPLVAIAMALTITNTLAFSRCDKFQQATSIAGTAFSTTGLAGNIASGVVGRFFGRS